MPKLSSEATKNDLNHFGPRNQCKSTCIKLPKLLSMGREEEPHYILIFILRHKAGLILMKAPV